MAKIVNRKITHYKGKVYDLKVDNSHSYNVESLGVHNSGAGSLVNYVLGITQVDPIKYNLLWERFLGRHRCLTNDTLVLTESGPKKLSKIKIGELVLTHTGELKPVVDIEDTEREIVYEINVNGNVYRCAPNHKWIVYRNGKKMELMALELEEGDELVFKD